MIGFRLLLSKVEQLRGGEYCTRAVAAVYTCNSPSAPVALRLGRDGDLKTVISVSDPVSQCRADVIGKHVQHVQGASAQLRPQFRRVSASVGAVATNAFFVRQISDGETHEVLSSAAEDYVSVAFTNFITTTPRAFPPTNGLHYVPA